MATTKGQEFINKYKGADCLKSSWEMMYKKGHITLDEFVECAELTEEEKASYDKQIDISTPKTNQELQEEVENLKAQLEAVHERLCTQQEMSSTVIAHVFGMEALKNE